MNLLITGAFPCSGQEIDRLEKLGYSVRILVDETIPMASQGLEPSWVEGIICNSFFLHNQIEDLDHLRWIQLTSAGYDRVPVDYIREHHIKLLNAKDVYSIPMAEFALCGVLELYKKSRFFAENQVNQTWKKHRGLLELFGRTVCIVGCGNVGRECAKRFGAFGCRVIGVDLNPLDNPYFSTVGGIHELDDFLYMADIVVLTLPLTRETYHLFDHRRLGRLKKDAVLVNIARGPIVDQEVLTEKLQAGEIGGAVLDVFEQGPLEERSPLWSMEQVVVTPHNSFVGEGNHRRLWNLVYHNLEQWREDSKDGRA